MFRRRKRTQADFSEELSAHLALEADRLRDDEGLTEQEALAAARRNLGNITKSEERFYESSRWLWLEHLRQDLRYSSRQLRQSPGFTCVAVLTLALGLGANTAIFSLIHAVMFKSLPVANPHQLFRLGNGNNCCVIGGFQGVHSIFSYGLYRHLRERAPEFEELTAFQAGLSQASVRRSGASAPPEAFAIQFVSGNYFAAFGVPARRGRALAPADDSAGAPPVAVMSYRAWERHYGLDPSVIGATFAIDGAAVTIAGIAPPRFFGDSLRPDPPDFWLPLSAEPVLRGQNSILAHDDEHWLYVLGRLKPGALPAAMEPRLTVDLRQWLAAQAGSKINAADAKSIARQRIVITPAGGGVPLMKEAYKGLWLLMTLSGLVLLIACANVANLLLARRAASRIQTSVRVALGAPRRRLISQTLTESLLLSVLGGAAGLAVAYAGARTILVLAFRGSNYVPIDPGPSLAVLSFAFLLSLLTGVLFGVVPAWSASHSNPIDALRGAGRSTGARATFSQKSLVVFQAALSLVLLSGAGILTQSLRNLEHQYFGFQTEGRLIVKVNPAFAGYTPQRIAGIYQRLQDRLKQIPGVTNASLSLYSPMAGNNWSSPVYIEGRPLAPGAEPGSESWDRVSPHYFETVGTRLLRGRAFDERDTPASRHVAVVNEAFVQEYFKDQDPIGKRFGMGEAKNSLDYEIVGVVENAKYVNAYEPAWSTFFLPLLQMSPAEWSKPGLARSNYIEEIELRVAGLPENLGRRIREVVAGVDPNLTVLKIRTFDEQLAGNFNQERLLARLTGLFGLLALLLASVGLYGIVAYSVARRSNEIGIRIALGAARASVVSMVLRGALLQIATGIAIGLPAALAGGQLLAVQLYGVQPRDPFVLGLATLVLTAACLLAGFLPARRAASLDPMQALRTD